MMKYNKRKSSGSYLLYITLIYNYRKTKLSQAVSKVYKDQRGLVNLPGLFAKVVSRKMTEITTLL